MNVASHRVTLGMTLLLVLMVWGVYANSLNNPFLFDDWHVIPQNPAVRGPDDIPAFFVDTSTFSLLPGNRDYRPVFLTSMALNWWWGQGETYPFHIVSVTVHLGSVLLLFVLLRWLFSKERDPSSGLGKRQSEWAAFLGAALFALHPLATEPINYINAQSDALASFFLLLSFSLFLKAHPRSTDIGPSSLWRPALLASYSAYFLGLMTKPIAICLPLIFIIWELTFGRREQESGGSLWSWHRRHLLKYIKYTPYAFVTVVYLLVRSAVMVQPLSQEARSFYVHFLTQTQGLVTYYLKLSVWPFGLNGDPQFPMAASLLDWPVLLSFTIVAGITYLVFRFRRQKNVVFWALWFPACLFLTTYAVTLEQVVIERRAYLSLAGFCALLGLVVVKVWSSFSTSRISIWRPLGRTSLVLVMAVAFVTLGFQTHARNRVWSSELSFWEDAALNGGTWRAHMNYGLALEAAGRGDEALERFGKAVELGPYAIAHVNLGLAHVNRGSLDLGIEHLNTAVGLWPSLPEAHVYLAYGLQKQGRHTEAEIEFLEALALRPNYLTAYRLLGEFYEEQGRTNDAIRAYQEFDALDPGQEWVRHRILRLEEGSHSRSGAEDLFAEGWDLQSSGRIREAIEIYEALLSVDPNHRQGTFNLAFAYLEGDETQDWERSVELFGRVVEIDPTYVEAIHHLAAGYWKLGDRESAITADQRYLTLDAEQTHPTLREASQDRLAKAGIGVQR